MQQSIGIQPALNVFHDATGWVVEVLRHGVGESGCEGGWMEALLSKCITFLMGLREEGGGTKNGVPNYQN